MGDRLEKLQGFGSYNNQERMAPAFRLPSAQGEPVAIWDYKQRRAVVLYFLPELDPAFLSQLQSEYAEYRAQGAQLLVISTYPVRPLIDLVAQLGLTYPLLSDADGRIYKRYLHLIEADFQKELPSALFIADRYGAINRYATAVRPPALPVASEVVAHLEFLGNLCNP